MTSPYRDATRPGGWVPWRERLEQAMAMQGADLEFEMSSPAVAHKTAYELRKGIHPAPPGRWRFTAKGRMVRARYLGLSG